MTQLVSVTMVCGVGGILEPIQGVVGILRWCRDQNDLVRVLISLTNTSKCLDLLEGLFGTMIGVDWFNRGRHYC